jgi:hypothetical protein
VSWVRYHNRAGDSGVVSYSLRKDGIALEFRDGDRYLYDATRPGPADVAQMIELARAGRGLSTFVSQHVRDRYARKLAPRR